MLLGFSQCLCPVSLTSTLIGPTAAWGLNSGLRLHTITPYAVFVGSFTQVIWYQRCRVRIEMSGADNGDKHTPAQFAPLADAMSKALVDLAQQMAAISLNWRRNRGRHQLPPCHKIFPTVCPVMEQRLSPSPMPPFPPCHPPSSPHDPAKPPSTRYSFPIPRSQFPQWRCSQQGHPPSPPQVHAVMRDTEGSASSSKSRQRSKARIRPMVSLRVARC